ncbi:MAG: M23 family metallopeptidase [Alphaproteobacteria bacterium]|nr:M23 family metallopeptidase [Alphaproteobacteria bacterium]
MKLKRIFRRHRGKLHTASDAFNYVAMGLLSALLGFVWQTANINRQAVRTQERIVEEPVLRDPPRVIQRPRTGFPLPPRKPTLPEPQPEPSQTAQELVAPIRTGVVTSPYGYRCRRVFCRYHYGIDIGANEGEKVYAAHSGTAEVGHHPEYGYFIRIKSARVTTVYAHFRAAPADEHGRPIQDGARVNQNTVIGEVGKSGNADGYHLHFEVLIAGEYVDPATQVAALARMPAYTRPVIRTRLN